MVKIHIGFDDIDTPFGGCTTHLVAKIILKWIKRPWIKFVDYPGLLRFNPGIPWKTRGNGGLVLRIDVPSVEKALDLYEEAVVIARDYIREFSHPESQPVVAAIIGDIPKHIKWLGKKCVKDVVPINLVERIIDIVKKRSNTIILYNELSSKGRRGLIGALASIGLTLEDTDYTYELIAYRKPEYWGKPRNIDPESVKYMDKATKGKTFLNYDYGVDKPLIAPHGPDPVLFGIRGEEPSILVKALEMVKVEEPIDSWIIYRTNQATDMHLTRISSLEKARIYTGVIIEATVSRDPKKIPGGHVIFAISDGERELDVAVYQPTGRFREIAYRLRRGDKIVAYGMIRPPSSKHGPTLNLEKLKIIEVAKIYRYEAPKCPRCRARMKSMGKNKGYKCPKCGYRDPKARKIPVEISRSIKPGFYQPPPRAFKHLMKPIERFGKEKTKPPKGLINKWCYPC